MGLFDAFKKKTSQAVVPGNLLEELLKKAATQAEVRAEFYNKLLSENLIVLTNTNNTGAGSRMMKVGEHVNLMPLNDGSIPVFTSVERIFDKGIVKEQVPYLAIKGVDLFTLTKGALMVLNPFSDYGKELLPDEIARMLNGTIMDKRKEIILEKDTQVLIGKPSKYPDEVIHALKQLFSERPNVNEAYLGWISFPGGDVAPHYIFGIDAMGDDVNIHNEIGAIGNRILGDGVIFDIIKTDSRQDPGKFLFKDIVPFYKK